MIKTYYLLTKPGIILGNLITTATGFLLASQGKFDGWLFLVTLAGLPSVIGSACVFNNYIDRHADKKMARTKNRALAAGLIGEGSALLFASLLGIFGFTMLFLFTNLLAALIAAVGFFVYVVVYSLLKYHTVYGTLIGSISGATPPVVGYCAVSNRLDLGALLLFLILVLWQMPHFYSIAMYRFTDYTAAEIPVLPVKRGAYITKVHMMAYIVVFVVAALMLTIAGYTGYAYLATAGFFGLTWFYLSIQGFTTVNDRVWGRKMFLFSLATINAICFMIVYDVK
jgi:protoheme IX farnesyltransferase